MARSKSNKRIKQMFKEIELDHLLESEKKEKKKKKDSDEMK